MTVVFLSELPVGSLMPFVGDIRPAFSGSFLTELVVAGLALTSYFLGLANSFMLILIMHLLHFLIGDRAMQVGCMMLSHFLFGHLKKLSSGFIGFRQLQ